MEAKMPRKKEHTITTPLRIDLGCGLNLKTPLESWVHIDADEGPHIEINTDFGTLPFDDDSVDEIWVGDVIEHIPVWRQAEVLTEWKRVLKPGGKLNGTTPNLDYSVRQYVRGEIDLGWLTQVLYGDRRGPGHQHYVLFTKETLSQLLEPYFGPVNYDGSPGGPNPWWLVFETHK
jgi:predicted SAM-dependent methyltransferase